jgi:hypothetical protein
MTGARAYILLVLWAILPVTDVRGADAPSASPQVLLMFDAPRVLSLNLDRPGDKPVTLIERAGWFRAHPSGHFILADKYYHTERDARWYVGHVKDPKAVKEVTCPLRDGEVLKDVVLSNDGDRVLWCTHRQKRDGRLLVTRVADGATTVALERPALGYFFTFGPPAWSPDDRSIAVVYLRTENARGDPQRLVSLIRVDLSGEKPTDRPILPEPYACSEIESSAPVWSPDGKRLVFRREEPVGGAQDLDHVVGVDGRDVKLAYDVVFLANNRHTMTDLKYAPVAGGKWTSVAGQLVDTTNGKSTPLKFESPVDATCRKWSPDGRLLVVGLRQPGEPARDVAVRLMLIDTVTGEKRSLMDTNRGVADEKRLMFVAVPTAR